MKVFMCAMAILFSQSCKVSQQEEVGASSGVLEVAIPDSLYEDLKYRQGGAIVIDLWANWECANGADDCQGQPKGDVTRNANDQASSNTQTKIRVFTAKDTFSTTGGTASRGSISFNLDQNGRAMKVGDRLTNLHMEVIRATRDVVDNRIGIQERAWKGIFQGYAVNRDITISKGVNRVDFVLKCVGKDVVDGKAICESAKSKYTIAAVSGDTSSVDSAQEQLQASITLEDQGPSAASMDKSLVMQCLNRFRQQDASIEGSGTYSDCTVAPFDTAAKQEACQFLRNRAWSEGLVPDSDLPAIEENCIKAGILQTAISNDSP